MAGPVAPAIYEAMGATVIPLYCEPDGTFPFHHPDPTEEKNLVDLRNTVRDHAADVGLAFDGDADRLGAISGDNRIVWGDQLMLLFAQSILKDHADAHFLAEVKCSDILFSRIRELGGRIEMGKVGHSLIKARMRETGALLAGEMSGHLFFNDRYLGYDDGIYAGARLIELLGRNEVDLTTFLDELPNTVATPEIRIPCSDDTKFAVVEAAKEKLRVDYELVEIDGLRLRTTDGWGLLRASNTQPALVMRVEAKSQESLADVRGIIESVVGELIDG
jgi:phosphomannomutase/phosphoglucomutase